MCKAVNYIKYLSSILYRYNRAGVPVGTSYSKTGTVSAILMHSPDLRFQNIANDCFLTELTGVNSSRNYSTLDLINDHGHIDYMY